MRKLRTSVGQNRKIRAGNYEFKNKFQYIRSKHKESITRQISIKTT